MVVSSSKPKGLIPSVSFFKGIAIFMVLFVHSTQRFALPNWLNIISGFGQMGCQIFFVLSAFTLCLSYERKRTDYFEFLKKRVSKVALPYWSMLIVYAIIRVLVAYRDNEDVLQALDIPRMLINALFLHGLVPDKLTMNGFVAGGWFLGTIFVLYATFPFLFKVFSISNVRWQKHKVWLFPLISFCINTLFLWVLGCLNEEYYCSSNSFIYFSFLNQLTCFCLGFSLFELHKKGLFSKMRCSGLIGGVFLVLAFVLFNSDIKNVFLFLPTMVGLSFLFLYSFLQTKNNFLIAVEKNKNVFFKLFNTFGENNLYLYLTHPLIMSRLAKILLKLVGGISENGLMWYILLFPLMFALSYLLAVVFRRCIVVVENIIKAVAIKLESSRKK